jgi:hypothetical protein
MIFLPTYYFLFRSIILSGGDCNIFFYKKLDTIQSKEAYYTIRNQKYKGEAES